MTGFVNTAYEFAVVSATHLHLVNLSNNRISDMEENIERKIQVR